MPKILKYLLLGFAAVVVLVLLGIAIIAATFNPNDYKPQLIKLVHDRTQRTLSIPGEITLTYFPNIGANLGKLTLSERNSEQVFASGEQASVSLALMPIFSRQFVIDHLSVDGLAVNIQRNKDGSSNFDDLLPKGESKSEQEKAAPAGEQTVQLDVGGIAITHANLSYTDEAARRKIAVRNLQAISGPIANGKKSSIEISADIHGENPRLALKAQLKSQLTLHLDQQRYVLNALEADVQGVAADISDLQLKLSSPLVEVTPTLFKTPMLSFSAVFKQGKLHATTSISGALDGDLQAQQFRSPQLTLKVDGKNGEQSINATISTGLAANLTSQLIELNELRADMMLPNPAGGSLALNAQGKVSLNLAAESVQATLAGKLDTSGFNAKLGLTKFAQPAYTFDMAMADLDLDRYMAPAAQAPSKSTPAGAPKATGTAQSIDLSALKPINARGKLKIDTLKVSNIKASQVQLEMHAENGRIHISPVAASLYGGTLNGAITVNATTPPRFAAAQSLRGVQLGPLLQDATGSTPVDGKGDVTLDINSAGDTVSQLKKSLQGTARFELMDGAVKGINIAEKIRSAKAKFGITQSNTGSQQGSGSTQEKTDFSELSGSFKISKGVASNHDLSAKTPLLRLGGNGDINLGEDRLDYTVKATVVPTLQGQGGPELQALKGLTIPVNLYGPFTAIGWKIDFAGMAGELAKGKVDEKKAQIKAQAQQKLDEQKDKVQDVLKGGLKGLFGK